MTNKITVEVDKPDLNLNDPVETRKAIKEISDVLAVEILAVLEEERQTETLIYWHNVLMDWKIEDARIEARAKAKKG